MFVVGGVVDRRASARRRSARTKARGRDTPAYSANGWDSRRPADMRRLEDLREAAFHHLAILQDVRDARRATQVILQHIDLPVAIADQVGPVM